MPRHRSQNSPFLGVAAPVLWTAIAVLFGAVVVLAWQFAIKDDSSTSAAGSATAAVDEPDCDTSDPDPVRVWAPPEAERVVVTVAGTLTECWRYDIRGVASAQAWLELSADRSAAPDIWITDAPVWHEAAAEEGMPVQAGPVLATSPVVLAAPADFGHEALRAGGLSTDASWQQLLALPDLPVTVGDVIQDPASLAMLHTAGGFVVDPADRSALLVTLAQDQIIGDPLDAAERAQAFFVPTSEQRLSQVDSGGDFSVLAPQEGAGQLTYQLLAFEGREPATEALQTALAHQDHGGAWRESGFRPAGAAEEVAVLASVPDEVPTATAFAPEDLEALISTWQAYALRIQMMVLIDVSGSMDDEVAEDGRTRVDLTREAAQAALETLSDRSRIGVRWFSTDRGPDGEDWVEAAPVRALNDEVGDTTHRGVLDGEVVGLDEDFTGGNTGLYDTLAAGYRDLVSAYDPQFRTSLVMLTDGRNRDPGGGLSQEELIAEIGEIRDDDRPVEVILLGMGPDVDAASMQRIAQATGGRYVPVREAEEMPSVLVGLVAARSRG
ncbi:MAG: VWA domain-containing protein [Ornithinimicrobium sp.]